MILLHESFTDIDPTAFDAVDTLVVDPPFSAHVHANAVSAGTLGPGSKGYVHRNLGFAPLKPSERFHLVMLAGRVRRWSLFHSDFESVGDWKNAAEPGGLKNANRPEYIRCVPWIRWSQPQKSGDRPGQQSEATVLFHRQGRKSWNGPGSLKAWGIDGMTAEMVALALRGADKHPTEKPLDLVLAQVCFLSLADETVADTHMGRGTTGLACRLLGRDFVGIERKPSREEIAAGAVDWFPHAKKRLEARGLEPRDRDRAEKWIAATVSEARRQLAVRETGDDEKTRARAEYRLRQAEGLARSIKKVAA